MCALIHSMSTHLVMLLLYHGPMGQSLVINPHISTKRAPHMLETPRHKGRGEPRSPDQWSVSCFSTIWHAEGFLRYSCAKKLVKSFLSNEIQNLKVTELVARCSVLSTSSSSFSPRSMITSILATMMSFTWSISDWTLQCKTMFLVHSEHQKQHLCPSSILT